MTMLIKGGLLHTMTAPEPFVGDVLVKDGRIAAVAEELPLPEEGAGCVLEAHGLTILPGLTDLHIHDGPEVDGRVLESAQASGVTAGLIWPEEEGACQVVFTEERRGTNICKIQPTRYTDAQLHARILALVENGQRIACEVDSAKTCRRVLHACHSSPVKMLLADLHGCEDLLEAVALAGCDVVLGVSGSRTVQPWTMVSRLTAFGVRVALSCGYPHAKLCHLPLCAALSVREGMERQRAMRTVTEAPAAILGLAEAGRIAPGCRADFVIYDGDPLLLATSHVMTIAGGKIRH